MNEPTPTAPKIVCALCGAKARRAADGYFRHARHPSEDVSTFCERYGYPIPVKTVLCNE